MNDENRVGGDSGDSCELPKPRTRPPVFLLCSLV